jgi:hypothetical protein
MLFQFGEVFVNHIGDGVSDMFSGFPGVVFGTATFPGDQPPVFSIFFLVVEYFSNFVELVWIIVGGGGRPFKVYRNWFAFVKLESVRGEDWI